MSTRVAAAVVLAVGATSLAVGAIVFRDEDPATMEQPAAVRGGTAAERALVRRVLADFGAERRLAETELGRAPARDGRWLFVTGPAANDVRSRVETEWQADVLLLALREHARSVGETPPVGRTLRLVSEDGDVSESPLDADSSRPAAPRVAPSTLVRMLERGAAEADVRVDEVRLLSTQPAAMAARLRTDDPEAFVCDGDRRLTALTRRFVSPGEALPPASLFLDVRDRAGSTVLAFAGAADFGGQLRVREDLQAHYPSGATAAERRRRLCRNS